MMSPAQPLHEPHGRRDSRESINPAEEMRRAERLYNESLRALERDIARMLGPQHGQRRILVVDDSALVREALEEAFPVEDNTEGNSVEICVITDPDKALAAVREEPWSALVIDVHQDHPTLSGAAIAAEFPRHLPLYLIANEGVTILSALSDRLNARRHFTKPLREPDFGCMVDSLREEFGLDEHAPD